MTGDEAYQRRLAMSSGLQQSTPSVAAVDRNMSGDAAHARRSPLAYNPFAPVSVPSPPPGPPPSIEDQIARKREAAAAIAAKFSALAAVQPPEELIVAPQNPAQRYFLLSSNVTALLKGS
jgi:splicing factor 45